MLLVDGDDSGSGPVNDLFWPGAARAAGITDDADLLRAMVTAESAWLRVLVHAGIAPAAAAEEVTGLVEDLDTVVRTVAEGAEVSGNPVIGLVELLRARLAPRNADAARWLHRGLTSQDTLDTALMLVARRGLDAVSASVTRQLDTLVGLAEGHRHTLMVGRTLTQYAVPVTFGLTAANWLTGVLDAAEDLPRLRRGLPVQLGGAAGTMAAVAELSAPRDEAATELAVLWAGELGLRYRPPWHTSRRPITSLGDVLVAITDACGRIAADVLSLGRPEVGELSLAHGGGSSTMPHKQNPVLAVLVRRAALTAPSLGAQLHLAAADAGSQRSAGAWHTEWAALHTLLRNAVVATSQTADLLADLIVHDAVMRARLDAVAQDALSEQRTMRELGVAGEGGTADIAEGAVGDYLGSADRFVTEAIERAANIAEELA